MNMPFFYRLQIFFAILWVFASMGMQRAPGEEELRDPTIPSPEIREKLMPPIAELSPSPQPTLTNIYPTKLRIRSMVLDPQHSGNAIVAIEDQLYSVVLPPHRYSSTIKFPKEQFSLKKTIASKEFSDDENNIEVDVDMLPYGDGFLEIHAFNERSIAFRFHPTGKIVIGR